MTPDGVIERVNATLSRWLEMTKEELVGKRFRDLLTIPGRIFYETNIAPLLRLEGAFEEVVLDLVTCRRETLPVQANALARHGPDGDLLDVRVVLFRAKGRRNYERDLHGRAAAAVKGLADERSTSELREQFIAVLGHDLRNPLASILGAARMLRREAQNEKATQILQLMESSVDRMAGLIDDVMDFARSRLGSGMDLHRTTGPLGPVLRQVVAELEISEPGRVIDCDIAVSEPVSFDAVRIGQLVSNLLGNALMHGDPEQPVRLHTTAADGMVEIWVTNSGQPIPTSAMERLFQPFFRGEVRPSQQGLGLGLHIASEIAKAHGGALTVRSDTAETRFTFTMPAGGGGG
jgi:sigma-B regulation protein RsbU (phosphoserine phosphatase)